MTDIEKKALALLNEVLAERKLPIYREEDFTIDTCMKAVLCRAIEQHETFRQEVSDAVEAALSVFDQLVLDDRGEAALRGARLVFARFILAKPDPLVEAVGEAMEAHEVYSKFELTDSLREALAKRGGKIVWGDEQ